jgi:hypothetical protein
MARDEEMICATCGGTSTTTITKGSLLIELFMWLCLIVPGIIYSLWRVTSCYEGCAACGGSSMIPRNSPMGRKLSSELGVPVPSEKIDRNSSAYKLGKFVKKLK